MGFCEVCYLVSLVKYYIINFCGTDGGGYISRCGSYSFKLALFIVNRQRVSWRIHGLLCLRLHRGTGVVCVIAAAP